METGHSIVRPWTVVISLIIVGLYCLIFIVWGTGGIIDDLIHPDKLKHGLGTFFGVLMYTIAVPLLVCAVLIIRRVRWARVASVIVLAALEVWIPIRIGFEALAFVFALIILATPIVAIALLFLPKSTAYFSLHQAAPGVSYCKTPIVP